MAENKVQDYSDDKNEGHVDTREANSLPLLYTSTQL